MKGWLKETDIIKLSSSEDDARQDFLYHDADERNADICGSEDGSPAHFLDHIGSRFEDAIRSDVSWLELVHSVRIELHRVRIMVEHYHLWIAKINLNQHNRAESLSEDDLRTVHHALY